MSDNTSIETLHDDDLADEALDERHGAKLLRVSTQCITCVR